MENSSKDICYRLFKENFEFETYLDIFSDKNRIISCKFRTCNHRLPIEIGRWQNIDRSDIICHICQTAEIGDEFHYILQCRQLHNDRKLYMKKKILGRVNVLKFDMLFQNKNRSVLRNLCKFIRVINITVCRPS